AVQKIRVRSELRNPKCRMHPDKNPDRLEEAKEEFQILQQAYETLSNPQERAWYDEHRNALLKGGLEADFDEDIIDIFPFMTSGCYKGFGDDEEGFYTIYRGLFEKLSAEEYDAGIEDSDEEIPNFGDSLSSYDDVVGPFYAFWESYCTRQNFGWVDEYDTRRAGNRRVARLMDKENKKFRSKAKQEWNQKVRALVDFVKRKDKRVQAWKTEQERILKEKEEALKQKQAEEKALRLKERKKLFEAVKSHKEKHNKDNADQLEQLESWMLDEFNEGEELGEEEEEEEMLEYCHPCQKSFRTKKALINHEKSKKHLAQLERWAAENNITTSEDSEDDGDDQDKESQPESVPDEEPVTAAEPATNMCTKSNGSAPASENPEHSDSDSEDTLSARFVSRLSFKPETSPGKSKRKGKSKGFVPVLPEEEASPTLTSKLQDDTLDDSFDNPSKKGAKEKKRRRAAKSATVKSETVPEPEPVVEILEDEEEHPKSKSYASKTHQCGNCKEYFDSRSKLFKHLEKTGHALPPGAVDAFEDDRKSSKKSRETPVLTKNQI
ncbi:unnamed protein product, partial [Allacma fusca]